MMAPCSVNAVGCARENPELHGGGHKLYHLQFFIGIEDEHEFLGEPITIAPHSLIQGFGSNSVQDRKVRIDDDATTSQFRIASVQHLIRMKAAADAPRTCRPRDACARRLLAGTICGDFDSRQ